MSETKYRKPSILTILLLVLLVLVPTGCGMLEVGVELTPTPDDAAAATVSALATESGSLATPVATPEADIPDVTPTPEPIKIEPTPILAATELRVAFVKETELGNNAWLWTEGKGDALPLTKDGGVGDVRISDDGEIVAFRRGDGLWTIRSDGADGGPAAEERELVSAEDFAAMEPREPFDFEVILNRFEWVPGTHILAFNTRLRTEIGLVLNDDLHLVNADTLERTALLPPGEGGEFHHSPDGRQIAVVTPGTISLMKADGSDRREVFTYTPVATYSEVQFYAQPVWAADSGSLQVAIPPVDPHTNPSPPTSIWRISIDGTSASFMGSVETGQRELPALSPDLRYVAHLHDGGAVPTSHPIISLLITDLDNRRTVMYYPQADTGIQTTLSSGETITEHPAATLFYGWAPDSRHFAFLTQLGGEVPPQVLVGQLDGDTVPMYDDAEIIMDVRWVDPDRYLFLAGSPRGWNIMLGEVGGPVKSVAAVVGSPPAYDLTVPPPGSAILAASTPQPNVTPGSAPVPSDAGDGPSPLGLIYQDTDKLWRVDADGQPVQVFAYPAANQYTAWPATSPDGARVLYTEEHDIWLVDVATGERRNLTQTSDRIECCAQWWMGQSDLVLFSSWTLESEGPGNGFPTVVQLDGSGYKVLDENQGAYALPAPSPDGETVGYDRAGQPWLYRPGTGPEPFDLAVYGLTSDSAVSFVSPAWSPDGRQLAWIIGGCGQFECQSDIGVFDLEAQTVQFVHPYSPVGRGGQPPAPSWSPDGRWLAFSALAMDADDAGLWVVRTDWQQEEKYRLDAGLGRADPHPIWSPDGQWLAFSSTPQGVGSGLWLAEVGTWALYSLDLPPDAQLVNWVSSSGN